MCQLNLTFHIPDLCGGKTLESVLKVRHVDLDQIYVAQDGTDAKVTKVINADAHNVFILYLHLPV
jgi:hypothetical protein